MKPFRTHLDTWKQNQEILTDPNRPSWQELDRVFALYPDLPREAIIKEDILRSGLAFTEDALTVSSGYKPKAYFIFSFDLAPLSELKNEEDLRSPEEFRLLGGPMNLRRTTISVRNNPKSPYVADIFEGKMWLFLEGQPVGECELPQHPTYYDKSLSNGKPVHEVAPTIEWGYLIYLTVYRQCQYWGKEEECLFCDINENYRQQKHSGRPYKVTKTIEEVLEALEIIAREESSARAYTLTGGSVTSTLQGMDEAQYYLQYARAIEERFSRRWIGKVVMQALPKPDLIPFQQAGIQIYHPNYEIWDKRLFGILCPGKERYVGREEWHKRILDSAEIFGQSHVIPNFVAGIEMAKPYGFTAVADAIASTAEGLDFFMSRGVSPRYTVWCPEPLTYLGAQNFGAPLELHAGIMKAWRDTHARYKLPVPPGYGDPGVGNTVFSVSAFMDVIKV